MGLDKWLKPEEIDKNFKKAKKGPEKGKKSKNIQGKIKSNEKKSLKLAKYTLVCQNTKCKYQKIIVKKQLSEEDKICPRCEKEMKIKVS